MAKRPNQQHRIETMGWLRAANDGIVSTASLILGVAAAHAAHGSILLTGATGLAAGAMSMATGEYVSVHSQADTEQAALTEEKAELKADAESEHRELAAIYVRRGLDLPLAREVADKLMAHDALGAHARDELGMSHATKPRPLKAAFASACSFVTGAALPLAVAAFVPAPLLMICVTTVALVSLASLGGLAAKIGGAKILPGILRVTFWSALAMAVTASVGILFGAPA
jgi:vacuolar iron transporter family protein